MLLEIEARMAMAKASILLAIDPGCEEDDTSPRYWELQQHICAAADLAIEAGRLALPGAQVPSFFEDSAYLTKYWQIGHTN